MAARIVQEGATLLIQLDLDIDEAENVARALGPEDEGGKELLALAERARQMMIGEGEG